MIQERVIRQFVSGTQNIVPDESITQDAASDSLNWITKDGHIELMYGRQTVGGSGTTGKNYGEHTGYRVDGTVVRFRKVDGTVQYLNGSTWIDVITGLTISADYVFSNYQSLAGAFVYIFGVDGVYKICTANPTVYSSLYVENTNFKGYAFIDKGRSYLWGRTKDATGLYGSWVDNQLGVSGSTGVYTSVSGEAVGTSGTLVFKAGGVTRTCFNIQIVIGTETYTDNYNGVLTSNLGGTGTINYTTGAYTCGTAAGTASYQWEDSNLRGVTDFRHSATRLAGEGFVVRQDAGGDAIKTVIPFNGSYFSLKAHSCYKFTLDATDLAPTNLIFRTDIGVFTLRSAIGTSAGIVYINTSNPSTPKLEIIKSNVLGDSFDVAPLFPQFAFEKYVYDDALLDSWDKYVIIGCKQNSNDNNRLLLCNMKTGVVDATYYGIRTSSKVGNILYGGDPISKTTYELLTGFDDNGLLLSNYWISKGETYYVRPRSVRSALNVSNEDALKKVKRLRFKGKISATQNVLVYVSYDDGDFQLVGSFNGAGDYVDYSSTGAVGTTLIGNNEVGGDTTIFTYPYYMEIKLHAQKFRKRNLKFESTKSGYVSIEQITDFDIWNYQDKLPVKYRKKRLSPSESWLDETETWTEEGSETWADQNN